MGDLVSVAVNRMKAEGREERSGSMKAEGREGRNGNMNAESKGAAESRSQTTTGQAGGGAKLSTEQRTKITNIIRQQKVAPAHLNVSIRVGNRVPASVRFYPLPAEVFVVYPEWRGYDYILVGNDILVINPRTHEIVAILEA